MVKLSKKKCVPCTKGTPPLEGEELLKISEELGPDWGIVNEHHIEKEFPFPDFQEALDFTNKIGILAEAEGHHPDIHLTWGMVRIVLWTHKINGLSESDFVLAAKINELFTAGNQVKK